MLIHHNEYLCMYENGNYRAPKYLAIIVEENQSRTTLAEPFASLNTLWTDCQVIKATTWTWPCWKWRLTCVRGLEWWASMELKHFLSPLFFHHICKYCCGGNKVELLLFTKVVWHYSAYYCNPASFHLSELMCYESWRTNQHWLNRYGSTTEKSSWGTRAKAFSLIVRGCLAALLTFQRIWLTKRSPPTMTTHSDRRFLLKY